MKSDRLFRTSILGFVIMSMGCGGKPAEEAGRFQNVAAKATPAGAAQDVAKDGVPQLEPIQRKIIQNATLDILVADFDKARVDLLKLKDEYKGFIAKSEFSGNTGSKRTETWTIRVPANWFQPFVDEVLTLGQPQRNGTEAQDVTEEYVDLEAVIKNLKAKESKLNELMQAKAQTLQDLVVWEKEVATVRGELARKEARKQTLDRLTAMATVNVTLRDEKEYIPSTKPSFGLSIPRTFQASVDALLNVGQSLLIALVALAPWSPLILVLTLFVRMKLRRARARRDQGFHNS